MLEPAIITGMPKIATIDILSAAIVLGTWGALVGLVAGILYSVGGLLYELVVGIPLNTGTALAFGALIGMPIIFAIPGLFVGAVGALFYNLGSKWLGRIEVETGK